MKKKIVIECEYGEIERLVTEHLKPPYEYNMACDLETGNDTSHSISVDGKLSEYNERCLKEALSSKKEKSYMTNTFMNELCRRGILEAGDYVVRISW